MVGRKVVFVSVSFALAILQTSLLSAADPTVVVDGIRTVGEQRTITLTADASDPDNDPLTYSWTLLSDPTGNAFLSRSSDLIESSEIKAKSARLGLRQGPNFPEPSFNGMEIVILLKVSDETTTVEEEIVIPVQGVNRPPELRFDTDHMGTTAKPRRSGQGLSVNAKESYDPDGGAVWFNWAIESVVGSGTCSGGLVLFGKETATPGFSVPKMRSTAPTRVDLAYLVIDDLNILRGTVTGYIAGVNGCGPSNTAPRVEASASPNPAEFGQKVTLTGTATDPGDSLTYSWIQLGSTAGITLANADRATASFTAPSRTDILHFQFTATDSKGAKGSTEVSVEIAESAGGGGGNGGGSGSGEDSEGTVACDQEGNQPAVASVPSRVEIISGGEALIEATNGRDPDNTTVFVNGILISGVTYRWEVANGAGILKTSDLVGSRSRKVSFDTPRLNEDAVLLFHFEIKDASGCGTSYPVEVILKASTEPNHSPVARLSYTLESDGQSSATGAEIAIESPAVILFDASESSDENALEFTFSLVNDLIKGSAELEGVSDASQRLIIADDSAGNVTVQVTVTDDGGLTDTASLSFAVEAFNAAPDAVVRYRLSGEDAYQTADAAPITVASPAILEIDAGESVDDGEFSVNFLVQQNLLSGGVSLSPHGEKGRSLEIEIGTQGNVTIVITVIDDRGKTDVVELVVEIEDNRSAPVAKLRVFRGESDLPEGQSAREGSIITLDASGSHLENGESPPEMAFFWKQTEGDPVNLMVSDGGRIARFRAPELSNDLNILRFELEVEHQGLRSSPMPVEVPVELSPIVYGQAAFGPFGNLMFRTVFVLINPTRDDLRFKIEFFDREGEAMDVMMQDELWDDQSFTSLAGRASRRLRFSGSDPHRTAIGWAKITTTRPLRGLVLYQLIDSATGALESEVSLFSSPTGERLTSFFDPDYNLAVALVNPGQDEARLLIQIIDPELGPDLPYASIPLILHPGQQFNGFLDESLFPGLPEGFQGTLVIEALSGQVAATLLKTNRLGVAISSLPLVKEKEPVGPVNPE